MPLLPRDTPGLQRAIPTDSPGDSGTHRSVRDLWEVPFRDGTWRTVEVRAWWTDRHGRWVIQVKYHVRGEGTFGEMYLADPERMRAFEDEPPEFCPWP